MTPSSPCVSNTTGRPNSCEGCVGCKFPAIPKKHKRYVAKPKTLKYADVIEFILEPRTAREIASRFSVDPREVTSHILPAIRAEKTVISEGAKECRRHQVIL